MMLNYAYSSSFAMQGYGGNCFKIIHQNIRSLRKNFDYFRGWINCLNRPNMIFLTETWIYTDERYDFKIPGYKLYTFCNRSMQSGGVLVYVRDDLSSNYNVTRHELISSDMIKVTLTINGTKIVFMCFYRLHGESKYELLEDLRNYLRAQGCNPNVVILGDMNIDILDNSTVTRNYKSLLSKYGLQSYIEQPTRIAQNKSSCLDHIFARFDNSVSGVQGRVDNLNITDHFMTSLSFRL